LVNKLRWGLEQKPQLIQEEDQFGNPQTPLEKKRGWIKQKATKNVSEKKLFL